jgi:hypothetical protein
VHWMCALRGVIAAQRQTVASVPQACAANDRTVMWRAEEQGRGALELRRGRRTVVPRARQCVAKTVKTVARRAICLSRERSYMREKNRIQLAADLS